MSPKSKDSSSSKTSTPSRRFASEDIVLGALLVTGLVMITVIICLLPAGTLSIETVQNLVSGKKKTELVYEDMGRGLFSLGKVQLSLANAREYVDSSMDIEYDRGTLRMNTGGAVIDQSGANAYFDGERDKMRDSIISAASVFTWKDVSGKRGLEEFREHLVGAVNESLPQGSHSQLITNLYFSAFIMFPSDEVEEAARAATLSSRHEPKNAAFLPTGLAIRINYSSVRTSSL